MNYCSYETTIHKALSKNSRILQSAVSSTTCTKQLLQLGHTLFLAWLICWVYMHIRWYKIETLDQNCTACMNVSITLSK